ncbi:MAG: hypothetical protein ACE5EF_06825, partial [Dehalococcoidia bacterium]
MRPDPDRVLRGVAMSLMMEVAPQVQTAFGQATVRMAGMLTLHAAAVVDGLADRLVKENAALAELLDAGSEVVGDPALAERLHAARTAGEVADLKVSTLVA